MLRGRTVGLAALALVVLAVAVACDNGGRGGVAGTPAPGPGGGLAACEALDGFKRYRYTFSFRLFSPKADTTLDDSKVGDPAFAQPPNAPTFDFRQTYEGTTVKPDRFHIVIMTEGQPDLQSIYIGEQVWTNVGDQWVAAPGPPAVPFPPAQVCPAVLAAPDFAGIVPEEQELNGITTHHYRFDRVDSDTAAGLFSSQSDMGRLLNEYEMDIWFAEEGWPARLEARSEATYPSGRQLSLEVTFEVRDVNAKDIEVEPPPL